MVYSSSAGQMTRSKPFFFRCVALLLLAAVGVFIVIHSNAIRRQVQRDLEKQAQVVAPSLWNLSPAQSQKYISVVADQYQYHSLIVRDDTGEIFSRADGAPLSAMGRVFDSVGLFPVSSFSTDIVFNGNSIGSIEVEWYDTSLYVYFYVLVITLLFVVILYLYSRLIGINLKLEETVRRRTEKLQHSEARFKAILNNHYQLTGLLDPNGVLLSANPASLAMIREEEDDIVGLSFCECPWWAKNKKLKGKIKAAVREAQKGNFVRFEVEFADETGTMRTIDLSLKPVVNDSGKLIYIVPEGRDITDLKNSQRETLKEKLFIDAVIKSFPGIFFIYDDEFRLIRWNKNHEIETGYSAEELQGKSILSHFTAEDREKVRGALQSYDPLNPSMTLELTPVNKDGSTRPYLYHGTMVHIEGRPYVIGTAFDISERKVMEEELQQALKMEAIGTLAGGIAHDFNNILAAILGYTELSRMLEAGKNPKLAGYLANINSSTLRARDLVQQILTFSRKGEQERAVLEVLPLIKETLKMLRSIIPANIIIRENLQSTDAVILANPTQIHQLLMNLCTNGYQAIGSDNGTICISLKSVMHNVPDSADGEVTPCLHLQVADDGCGMDSVTLEKIFDPYFTTKGVQKGTGLGLSLVHGIIESHGGTIAVESTPGQGTVFDIYLPLVDRTDEKRSHLQQQATAISSTEYHLLCVDDETAIQDIFKEYISGMGYKVTCLSDPVAALHELQQYPEKFDLLITDMTMPLMTGRQLAEKILSLNPDFPIIICTGFSVEIDREQALAIGIREYIEKPVDFNKLSQAIGRVLEENDKQTL